MCARWSALVLAGLLLPGVVGAAEPAIVTARRAVREALAAHAAGKEKEFLAGMELAVRLRPDVPRMLVDLAVAQVVDEKPDEAIATLEKLADLGVATPIDREAGLASLRARPEFVKIAARIAANAGSVGPHDIAFTLPEMTGLIEGIAANPRTGEFYFSDVHHRIVWARAKDGKVRRFTSPHPAVGAVFGIAADLRTGSLWAATGAVRAMAGYTSENQPPAGLAEFDLESGQLKRFVAVAPPDAPVLGDVTVAAEGAVFATDSLGGAIWRLAPGARALEKFVESDEFFSLQGIVVAEDGNLYVADYTNGLLRVEPGSRKVVRIPNPANATLIGIDGLAAGPDGSLLAVQNGMRPMRAVRIMPGRNGDGASVETLEAGHLGMAGPSLGVVADGQFYFVGNAGWSRFEGETPRATAPRPVPVFRVKLTK